jgi:ElaB/YqjD/DUF883 family membrane-anchored ribosome-binding protein
MAQSSYTGTSESTSSFQDQATAASEAVAERGREAREGVQEVASNFKGALDKSITDQPMATLAVVAAIGFVLGALWKA